MARTKLQLDGFGGLNTKSPAHMLKDKELAVCQNFYFGQDGELRKRPGLKRLANTIDSSLPSYSESSVLLWSHWASAVTDPQVWFAAGSTVYKSNSDANFVNPGFAAMNIHWAESYNGALYLGTTAQIKRVDGDSTLVTLANSPMRSDHGCFHKNRLFVSDNGVTAHNIIWSDAPGDPSFPVPYTDWPATNTWTIGGSGYTDTIHMLVSFNDILYIFKKRSIWALHVQGDSPASWTLRLISKDFGCSARHGVIVVENYMYFIGTTSLNKNVFVKTDGYTFAVVSDPVEPLMNYEDRPFELVWNMSGFTPVRYDDNILFLRYELTGSDFLHLVLCYNYKLDIWSTWYFPNHYITGLLQGYSGSTNRWVIYAMGMTVVGNVSGMYRFSNLGDSTDLVFADQDLGYQSKFRTKEFMSGGSEYQRILQGNLDYESASAIDARYITEGGTTELPVAAAGGTRSNIKVAGPQTCRRVSYEFDDVSVTNNLKVYSFGIDFSKNASQGKAKAS